jgi:carbonic anhydrase/acetyltransferase-like protein (isoleucine patch superfamily)
LPFAEPSATATFIDPSVLILRGNRIVIGKQSFVGPYATLNAGPGSIKIGAKSAILDNASVVAGSNGVGVAVGDSTVLSFGSTVRGSSQVGGFGDAAKPTYVGPNALIDGAVVQPGAFVSTLARVGPGVNVPGGVKVLPGVNVTTDAEASNPALGKVVPLSKADSTFVKTLLANHESLAAGYTTLYQGNKATGPSVGTTNSTVFNGDLATVEGTSREPGPSNGVKFEPGTIGPKFLHRPGQLVEAGCPQFRARVIGGVVFNDRPANIAHHLGKRNSIRADQGQPITIDSIAQTGRAVTISSPLGVPATNGQIFIGREFRADDGAVLLGGPGSVSRLSDGVTLGAGSVVEDSSIGAGSTIGRRAFVAFSTLPPGSVIPDGWIVVGNKFVGNVQW